MRRDLLRGDVSVIFFNQRQRVLLIDVTDDNYGGVIGRVVGPIKLHRVLHRDVLDVAHPADGGPVIGMLGKRQSEQLLGHEAVHVVFDAQAALADDHPTLGLDGTLFDDQVLHALRLQLYG